MNLESENTNEVGLHNVTDEEIGQARVVLKKYEEKFGIRSTLAPDTGDD
ncbi:hypothetical protein KKA15_05910 [Patescibacteria group bacterium]|nr:hypothetical protein [Patescibacteria group bacterium]